MGLKHHKLATLRQRVWTIPDSGASSPLQWSRDGRICQIVARPVLDRSCLRHNRLQPNRNTLALLPDVRRDVVTSPEGIRPLL